MTNHLSVSNLPVITHNNVPVITTELLSQLYSSSIDNIKKNYSRNQLRFIEGKHYFKLAGNELDNLRVTLSHLQISSKTRSLILWTERGAARHAKMLETDQAWEVFEKLEDYYFNKPALPVIQHENAVPVKPTEIEFINTIRDKQVLTFNADEITQLNALFQNTIYLNDEVWPHFKALFTNLNPDMDRSLSTIKLTTALLKKRVEECSKKAQIILTY